MKRWSVIIFLSLALSVLLIVITACNPTVKRVYYIGDTCENNYATTTLITAHKQSKIVIGDEEILPRRGAVFVILRFSMKANIDLLLDEVDFKIDVMDIYPNVDFSAKINGDINYIQQYALHKDNIVEFNVVYEIDISEFDNNGLGFSVPLYSGFYVESSKMINE